MIVSFKSWDVTYELPLGPLKGFFGYVFKLATTLPNKKKEKRKKKKEKKKKKKKTTFVNAYLFFFFLEIVNAYMMLEIVHTIINIYLVYTHCPQFFI